ncbi:hypothetical protein GO755_04575 [Spirosoma sp. HMF4905]|uniref:Uncharacterized protein n=1 Tax=Spirosoma arboris TaxID=2682092 RepID=A0A7K1S659_9BACT|nr:hypothetical protein [Spirosoma arboris]MVM29297.1 hypothetical protein [Spirosoma arboris]
MLRSTHRLDYQSVPDQEVEEMGLHFVLPEFADQACDCLRESAPNFDRFAQESFEQFIARLQLRYCPTFNALVGDKCSHYTTGDLSQLYWFHDCCSMGGSYRTLVAVTSWPGIRLKTDVELEAQQQRLDELFAEIKRLATTHSTSVAT